MFRLVLKCLHPLKRKREAGEEGVSQSDMPGQAQGWRCRPERQLQREVRLSQRLPGFPRWDLMKNKGSDAQVKFVQQYEYSDYTLGEKLQAIFFTLNNSCFFNLFFYF